MDSKGDKHSSDDEIYFDAKSLQSETNSSEDSFDTNETSEKFLQGSDSLCIMIEEKTNEIKQKLKTLTLDTSNESVVLSSPKECNVIAVQDVKRSQTYSITEMHKNTISQLQSKLEKAEKELKLKEGEVSRLRNIRDEVEPMVEDLAASVFEEANKVVKAAERKQLKVVEQAKGLCMKLTILQDEVNALKTPDKGTPAGEVKIVNPRPIETHEIDPVFLDEFIQWRREPTLARTNPFIKRLFKEDFEPCLSFKNSQLSKRLLEAIQDDSVTLENIIVSKKELLPMHCALLDAPRLCTHTLSFGQSYYYISTLARNRIASICDLLCYLRCIQNGLVTQRDHEIYLDVLRKRRKITSAKLGLIDNVV